MFFRAQKQKRKWNFGEMVKLFLMFRKYSTMNVLPNVVTATDVRNSQLVLGGILLRVRRSEDGWRNLGRKYFHGWG